jgi:uncharacterized protein (TIGR03790 family)
MAKNVTASWEVFSSHWRCVGVLVPALFLAAGSLAQPASEPSAPSNGASSSRKAMPEPRPPAWVAVPRVRGHLTAKDIGLVINSADPYSVEVGAFYAAARQLAPEQILRVELPVKPTLTPEEFAPLAAQIEAHFGADTQALALAWTTPYAVNCNSITGAVTLGYDPTVCFRMCAPSRASPYFNSASVKPYTDLKLRPSMLLGAKSVAGAKALIERGVAADHSLGLRGAPPVNAYFLVTSDKVRSVRAPLFPPPGPVRRIGLDIRVEHVDVLEHVDRVLLYITGLAVVRKLDRVGFVPGALADHLTSSGGVLDGTGGHTTATDWIAAGATASYGSVTEPCAHPQKFSHPQVLLLHYAQGSTAIEAYWKSVLWPSQGVFVGEPLATPFSRR